MRRWLGVVALLAAVGAALTLLWWPSSQDAKQRLEGILSDALHRPVHIETLDVAATRGEVELRGVSIGNPPGFEEPYLLTASRMHFDVGLQALLHRRLVGTVVAQDVELVLVRQGGRTNLEGMVARSASGREAAPRTELDLDVRIFGAEVVLHDRTADQTAHRARFDDVDIRAHLSDRAGETRGEVAVDVARVTIGPTHIHNLHLLGRAQPDRVVIDALSGRIGDTGDLTGSGAVELAGAASNTEPAAWRFDLTLRKVGLTPDVLPIVATFYPPIVTVVEGERGPDAMRGFVGGSLSLQGQGLQRDFVATTLQGEGTLSLQDVTLPADALAVQLAGLAGRPAEPWTMDALEIAVSLEQGWVHLDDVALAAEAVEIPVRGRVHVTGALDLRVDLMPLLRVFGTDVHRAGRRYASTVPIRIEGTMDAPEIALPSAEDIGASLLGGAVRRALQ